MHMHDGLSCIFPAIVYKPEAVRFQAAGAHNIRQTLVDPGKCFYPLRRRGHFIEIGKMFFGDKQKVNRCDRIQILKSHQVFILKYLL